MTHVEWLTVEALATAEMRARTVMHPVELVVDSAHVIVTVDQKGGLVIRPEEMW
jgi:hypothetical protein